MHTLPAAAEAERQKALRSYDILDTPAEPCFDDLTYLAAEILGAPVALVSLVDAQRVWFKSHHGIAVREGPREPSFCAQAILGLEPLIVPDAGADPRFGAIAHIAGGSQLRFYAGVPLINGDGHALGTLCVIDRIPRMISARQIDALRRLAAQAIHLLELRRSRRLAAQATAQSREALAVLHERSQQFHSMVDAIGDYAIVMLDAAGRITGWNSGAERLKGYRAAQIVGRHFSIFYAPEDQAGGKPQQELEIAAQQGRATVEGWRVRQDGTRYFAHVSTAAVRDPGGTLRGYVKVIRDVTEAAANQQGMATLLRENAGLLTTLHEHALVSVADADGRITEVNDGFCALSGYTREELLGSTHRIVNSGVHTQRFWTEMWRTVSSGVSWRREVCNRAKDGSLYWVDSMVTPFHDPQGRLVKYIAIRFDITPLKQAQQRLVEKEALLERVEALSGVGGIRVDLPSGTQSWTRQTFRIHDMVGEVAPSLEELDRLAPPEGRARLQAAMAAAVASGTGYDVEAPMLTAQGRPIWVRTIGAVEVEDGRPVRVVGSVQDITERKLAENALRRTNERLALATRAAGMGIWEWGLAGNTMHWDEQMYRLYGLVPQEPDTCYRLWLSHIHAEDRERIEREFQAALANSDTVEAEFRIVRLDQEVRHMRAVAQVERDPAGNPTRMVGLNVDVTQSKAMELQLVAAARYDKLTGLANRALFMTRLELAVLRVQAGEQRHYAVLFLDFDRFKVVNDTLGHEAGDELLRQIALRLRGELRASDVDTDSGTGNVVSRFGGDEFLLLINDLSAPADAVRIAERLLNALSPAYEILGSEVHSSASIGIVTSEQGAASAQDVVSNADLAMYEAKRSGRGCSVVFNEGMHTRLTRHVQIETSLRRAIGTDQLSVVYQPIVELATGRLASAEALVRWQHPTLGALSPSEFIPIAEESGLIVALDEWVLQEACRAMVQWRAQDPARAPDTISVNLSRAELALGQPLLDQLCRTLERAGLPPHCLQLEVTEREVTRNPVASRKLMQDLKSLGVRLAMDDFGTGTSSLAFLRDYPFDTIKVDRAFVQGLSENADVLAVIHATLCLVENLHMASLVEGVEDPAQLAILQSLGCRYAQGYLFSRPVPAAQLLGALQAQAAPALQEAIL